MTQKSRSKFIFRAPFNSLSFGQVSYNLAKGMYEKGLDVSIFPIGETADLSAYDPDQGFVEWLKSCVANKYIGISKDTPCLQLWHIRGSDSSPTRNSLLYTFHEISGVTDTEKSVCSLHESVIFSSKFSERNFLNAGVDNVFFCNPAFDDSIKKTDEEFFKDQVHFVLVGKWEKRKNTLLIIKTWIDLFGNNRDYKLTCLVDNPFFDKSIMETLKSSSLGGKQVFNVTFLPRLKTNAEVNMLYNSADIDLSGLSSAEGWNLPAFNMTALGKWSCVLDATAHQDWANSENSILVEPRGTREPYDKAFFAKGDAYNQGVIFDVAEEQIRQAIKDSVKLAKTPNPNGELLRDKFTYGETLDGLLNLCGV